MSWSLKFTIPNSASPADATAAIGAAFSEASKTFQADEKRLVESLSTAATAAAAGFTTPGQSIEIESYGHMAHGEGYATLNVKSVT